MKIRTNFVTNSSSYSSAEIKIDNPVLLEILKKYREKGAFIRNDGLDLGNIIGSSERESKSWEYEEDPCYDEDEVNELIEELDDTQVALYLYNPECAEISFAPESLEDIVNVILDVIADGWNINKLKNKSLFEECKKELLERASEINKNYVEVSWEASDDSYGESEPEEDEETSWEFYYKK